MAKGKKRLSLAAAAILGLLCAPSAWAAKADTVYTNGKIYTMDDLKSGSTYDFSKVQDLNPANLKTVEVVAARDGKVVFAGSKADAEAQGWLDAANTVDLQGRYTMLPGFVDGHGHFPAQGQVDLYSVFLGSPPLGAMEKIEDIQNALNNACARAKEGEGVTGTGYDDTLLQENRHPTWMDIEGAPNCQGKDVRLSHISGHVSVASKSLLVKAGMMTEDGAPTKLAEDTTGVEIVDGKVTGVLYETIAMGSVGSPQVSIDQKKALARANDYFLARGVTLADNGLAFLMGDTGSLVQYQQGLKDKNLTVRVAIHPLVNIRYDVAGNPVPAAYKNLLSLYWQPQSEIENPLDSQELVDKGFMKTAQSPDIGQDITLFKEAMASMEPAQPEAEGGIGLDPKTKDMLFLGSYKILGDGSPQAYTAWMKDPGNYNWGDYTAENRFALSPNAYGETPLLGSKYDTANPEHTAAPTLPPYFNGLPGTVNVYPHDLHNVLEVVHRSGHSTEIHTNGSAYAEAWLEGLEKAVSKYPDIADTRHCSIHAQTFERNILERLSGNYASVNKEMTTQLFGALGQKDWGQPGTVFDSSAVNGMSEQQLSEAMKKQNFVANYFVTHTYYYGERHRDIFFGPGRANNISPAGWTIRFGIPYAFHNDNTVTPIEPLQSMESAVIRESATSLVSPGHQVISGTGHDLDATVTLPSRATDAGPVPGSEMKFYNYDQRINGAQALVGVTIGPAYQNKLDDRIGSIAQGKFADFVILDNDPVQLSESSPRSMSDIRVTATIVGDKPLYGKVPGSRNNYFNVAAAYAPDPDNADNTITNVTVEDFAGPESELVAIQKDQVHYGAYTVKGQATGKVATLQMHILGNGSNLQDFQLYINSKKAEYGMSAAADHFWVTEADTPTVALPLLGEDGASTQLAMNKDYIVVYTVAANAGAGADNVDAFVEMVAQGQEPTNYSPVASGNGGYYGDDSSSGCTVGDRPAYDLAILGAMLMGMLGLSGLRFSKKN